jgi:hypothetical protein
MATTALNERARILALQLHTLRLQDHVCVALATFGVLTAEAAVGEDSELLPQALATAQLQLDALKRTRDVLAVALKEAGGSKGSCMVLGMRRTHGRAWALCAADHVTDWLLQQQAGLDNLTDALLGEDSSMLAALRGRRLFPEKC